MTKIIHPLLPLFATAAMFLASCADKKETQPPAPATEIAAPLETLWVADQFTGMMGMWMRHQQRYVITDSTVSYQDLNLRLNMGEGAELDIYSGTDKIVSHLKSEHGGVIELEPGAGESLSIQEYLGDDPEGPQGPQRTLESFDPEDEEDLQNSFLVYRWLDGGRVDLVGVYPDGEGDGEAPPPDSGILLEMVADPAAFDTLRLVDEESLLPDDPVFVSHAELKRLAGSLKEFSTDPTSAFAQVSAALDQRWKNLPDDGDPKHLSGVGLFTGAHRFGAVFRDAMIDAGYNPYLGSFAFAKAKLGELNGEDLDADEAAEVKAMQDRLDPYAERFEASLRPLAEASAAPASLPDLVTEADRQNAAATTARVPEDEAPPVPDIVPPPPPPLAPPTPDVTVAIRNADGYLAPAADAGDAGSGAKAEALGIQETPFWWKLRVTNVSLPNRSTTRLSLSPVEGDERKRLLAGFDGSVGLGTDIGAAQRSGWSIDGEALVYGKALAITSETNRVRGWHLVARDGGLILSEDADGAVQWILDLRGSDG